MKNKYILPFPEYDITRDVSGDKTDLYKMYFKRVQLHLRFALCQAKRASFLVTLQGV
jgi:hypothetical protein